MGERGAVIAAPSVSIAYDVRPSYDPCTDTVVYTNRGPQIVSIVWPLSAPLTLHDVMVGTLCVDKLIYQDRYWRSTDARLSLSVWALRQAEPSLPDDIADIDLRFVPLRWRVEMPRSTSLPAEWHSLELEVLLTEYRWSYGRVTSEPCAFVARRVVTADTVLYEPLE